MSTTAKEFDPLDAPVDLGLYPIHEPGLPAATALADSCRQLLGEVGSFSLPRFLRPDAVRKCLAQLAPLWQPMAFAHRQTHNVWFGPPPKGLASNHGALIPLESENLTLACDRLRGTVIRQIYEWDGLKDFLAAVFEQPGLEPMADPLARLNVMGYARGQGLNWHFDRARYTVTLLLQSALAGGEFQYRPELRAEDDPNYDGVARLLAGEDEGVRELALEPGTLNVFAGRYAAHRVTPTEGDRMRVVAVLSYVDGPGMQFSKSDRRQFYGRAW